MPTVVHAAPPADRRIGISAKHLGKHGLLTPATRRSKTAEEMRLIRRRLSASMQGSDDRSVMITSAVPQEGKSVTALNLALSACIDDDVSVLLIDADPVRGALHRRLGLPSGIGLTDFLLDPHMELQDVVLQARQLKLSVVRAGTRIASAADLFASKRMRDLLRLGNLDQHYDFVILDTPPVLACAEAAALAPHVGRIAMVVDAQHGSRSALESALDLLPETLPTYLVLNRMTPIAGDMRFGAYHEVYRA